MCRIIVMVGHLIADADLPRHRGITSLNARGDGHTTDKDAIIGRTMPTPTTLIIDNQQMLTAAQQRASELGLSLRAYVNQLIVQDTTKARPDRWGPVPQQVAQRWQQELRQFEAEEQQGLHQTYHSLGELVQALDL